MRLSHFAALLAPLALAACSNLSRQPDSNDALIARLSDAQRKPIDAARTEHDHTTDDLASARQELVRAKAEREVAKADLDVAVARVNKAEAAVTVAETGTAEELADAREKLRVAKAAVVPQNELIRWRTCDVVRCEKAETLALRVQEVAAARVRLEKSRAYVKLDESASRADDVTVQEAAVRGCEKQASLARVELDAATGECTVAERAYDDAKSASKKN